CTKSGGDMFLGTWKDVKSQDQIIVTKAGETAYTIRSRHFSSSDPSGLAYIGVSNAIFKDGNLGGCEGFISLVDGRVVFNQKEYEKTVDADPAIIEKEEISTEPRRMAEWKRITDSIRVADSMALVMANMRRIAN
ncbi:MAG: hypothetical protein WCL00_07395, partial [Bacteroidota bacterium]